MPIVPIARFSYNAEENLDFKTLSDRYTNSRMVPFLTNTDRVRAIWIYVKIRYENFHCSVIVDNMKEDCVLLETLRMFQGVVHVLCALCALGFKKDGKYGSLNVT